MMWWWVGEGIGVEGRDGWAAACGMGRPPPVHILMIC